jgi:Uma2 family endonuclease
MSALLERQRPTPEPESVMIPLSAMTWNGYREWITSDAAPERGRFAFLADRIYVEMSPERLGSHNDLKSELSFILRMYVRETGSGFAFADGALVSHEAAQVSNEPDAVYVSRTSITSGRVTLVPAKDLRIMAEIVGTPDLVAEVLSPSSVGKDYRQLRSRYHAAGIPEYWLLDALGDEPLFQILRHEPAGYEPVPPREGWIKSAVLNRELRLDRILDPVGLWQNTLHVRPLGAA